MPKGIYERRTVIPPPAREPILTDEEKRQVARWLGEFIPPQQVHVLVKQTFGKEVSRVFGYHFQQVKRWALLIDRYRQEWLVKIADVPLYHHKYRLQRLQDLIERLDIQRDKMASYQYERRLLTILNSAQREMDKPSDQHTWLFNVSLNGCSDVELVQRREALLKRIQQFRLPIRTVTPEGSDGLWDGRKEDATPTGEGTQGEGGDEGIRDTTGTAPGTVEPQDGVAGGVEKVNGPSV